MQGFQGMIIIQLYSTAKIQFESHRVNQEKNRSKIESPDLTSHR
jgi:hypothetical protein